MKSKQIFKLILLVSIFLVNFLIAQNPPSALKLEEKKEKPFNAQFCGTDFIHKQKMDSDPKYKLRHIESVEQIKKLASSTNKIANSGVVQIPVVLHIMHKGEAIGSGTNISDEDAKNGLKYLNNYWRKMAGSLGFGKGVDMKIEFALAIQDPSGNCTTGIDRVNMSSVTNYVNNGVNNSGNTGIEDYNDDATINSLKEYSIWDPTKYYNVWLVDEIDNNNCSSSSFFTAGYAYYASSHGQAFDGSVVLICSYLDEKSTTWAHEMGHAFNLPHTFDGDDSNNDGKGDICGDDGIADTPEHIRTSSISPTIYFDCDNNGTNTCDPTFNKITNPDTGFSRNSGTHQDHMHNYMDYTSCDNEFTGGQRTVVNTALNGTRKSFLTSPALTPATTATVFFNASAAAVCLGSTVDFYDLSSCTPNTYTNASLKGISFLWTFNNNVNTPITSTLQNPSITFNTAGVYDVTLAVTNAKGTTSLKKAGNIVVTSSTVAGCTVNSTNKNNNYGNGVTKVSFNTLQNETQTFIPANAINDFVCTKNTSIFEGTSYDLTVNYKARIGGSQFLEVWIDWDNSGTYQTSNSNGINEQVLSHSILESTVGNAKTAITAPVSAVKNTLLRMRVISDFNQVPKVCGNGFVQRADDYGVYVKAACTPPTAAITNTSNTTVLTCAAPKINLTATGGASYSWNKNMGITPTISVSEPGTYIVTVTSANGCQDTEQIIITENKPAPTAMITNLTGLTGITCSISSIKVKASGGNSYSWDNGLGNTAEVNITKPGTYAVTVTAANGCKATKSITITNAKTAPICNISSFNNNANYGAGVTNVKINTINKTTTTSIPASGMNDFVCSDQTVIEIGKNYLLSVTYKSLSDASQFLEVWIDWDNNGVYSLSNTNGISERLLSHNILAGKTATPTANIKPPTSAVLDTFLRMRVVSEMDDAPTMCGRGFAQRADDYAIMVKNPSLNTTEFLNTDLVLYPNPAKEKLQFSLKNNVKVLGYQIADINGKIIVSEDEFTENTILVSKLAKGVYFIKVKTTEGDLTTKFIKE